MPDQGQNHTAKSFSSVWVFLWLQAPAQKPGECLAAKYSTVSSGPYSTLQITLFQNQGVSSPMKLANAKKLHRKWCAFLFVCNLPLSPDSCFLSGTFIAFYQNWILSAFLILQAQKQALFQLSQNTTTSLCKHHSQHHCGTSPSFLPWVAF